MSEHRLRLSAAHIWVACPGSTNLCATVGQQPTTPDAQEGTFAHKVAEVCLKGGFDPEDLVGRTLETKEGVRFEVTPGMAEPVGVFVDHVRSLFAPNDGTCTVLTEHKVSLESVDPDVGGTLDVGVYDAKTRTLHIGDFKFGVAIVVEIDGNLQIHGYGLGAFLAVTEPIDQVVLHVVQPRADHPDGPIRSLTVDPMDLLAFGNEIRVAAERTRQPDAPLIPGDHCQMCDARGVCPKLYEVAQEAEQLELEDAIRASEGGQLDADELGKRLDVVDKLRLWLTGITRYAWREAQRGHVPTGYKLVTVRGKRAWLDGPLAMRQAQRAFRLSEDQLYTKRAISPRKLEALVGEKDAAEFIKANLARKKRSVALVREDDPRPATKPAVMDDLQDIFEDQSHGYED